MERSVLTRRAAPVAVFAAVLAALLVIAAVSRSGGDGDARDGAPRPLKLSAGFRAEGATTARSGGAPSDSAASAPAMYGGEIVIPDRLLTGLPTEGPAYDLTPGDTSTSRIAALAKALGVSGEVRTDADGWVVGDGDRVLRVHRQPGTPWYVGADKAVAHPEPAVVPVAPETLKPSPPEAPDSTTDDGDTPVSSDTDPGCKPVPEGGEVCAAPAPPCPPPPPGAEPAPCDPPRPMPEPTKPPQPSDSEARAAAQRVFDALGLSGATVTVNDAWIGKEVVAAPVVGGLPTLGFETRVTVVADGSVEYANGLLGGTDLAATYPLLAPRDAVKRGGAYGRPAIDYACPEGERCPTPEPREATGLRLGLMLMGSYDGSGDNYLVPAWLLTFEGGTWEEPVLALPDEYVDAPDPATDAPASDTPATSGEVPPDGGAGSTGSTGTGSGAGGTSGGSDPGAATTAGPTEPAKE